MRAGAAMRGAAALRALPSAVPRLPRRCVAVSPRLLCQPLGGRAPRSVAWPGARRHLHSGRVLRTSDTVNEAPESVRAASDASDVRSNEDAALIDALDAMLAEEDLDDGDRAAVERALVEARAGRAHQALQVLDDADSVARESTPALASPKLPEEMGPQESAYACHSAPVAARSAHPVSRSAA